VLRRDLVFIKPDGDWGGNKTGGGLVYRWLLLCYYGTMDGVSMVMTTINHHNHHHYHHHTEVEKGRLSHKEILSPALRIPLSALTSKSKAPNSSRKSS